MKPTEYPEEDSRTVSIAPAAAAEEPRTAAPKTRYVEVPPTPEQARAQRNLALGIVCLVLAAIALWLGLKIDRMTAALCLASSLGTFGVFWLFYNFQILRQRHGFFLGLGLVAVFAAILPFAGVGFRALDRIADETIAGKGQEITGRSATLPVPTAATAPPAPSAPEISPENDPRDVASEPPHRTNEPKISKGAPASKPVATTEKPAGPVDDGIVRDFIAPEPDLKAGRVIRIMEDCIVTIDGRKWRLKAGQTYPLDKWADEMVTFHAGDQIVKIDEDLVKFVGASKETPASIEKMAMQEAFNRYPDLGDEDSKERQLFNRRKFDMQDDPGMAVIFKDPKWPLVLADELATQHNWHRADASEIPVIAGDKNGAPAAPTPPGGTSEMAPKAGADSKAPVPNAPQVAPSSPAEKTPAKPSAKLDDKDGWTRVPSGAVVPKIPAESETPSADSTAALRPAVVPSAPPVPAVIPPAPGH